MFRIDKVRTTDHRSIFPRNIDGSNAFWTFLGNTYFPLMEFSVWFCSLEVLFVAMTVSHKNLVFEIT